MKAFNFSTCSGLTRAEKVTLPEGLRPAPSRFPPLAVLFFILFCGLIHHCAEGNQFSAPVGYFVNNKNADIGNIDSVANIRSATAFLFEIANNFTATSNDGDIFFLTRCVFGDDESTFVKYVFCGFDRNSACGIENCFFHKSEFPAQQTSRAPGVVANFVGVAEHRALGTDTAQFHHVFDKMLGGFNFDVPQHCAIGVSGWWMEGNGSVKQIKCGESDWLTAASLKKPFPAVDNRSHGDLVCGVAVSVADAPTGMNLAVKSDFRKSMLKPVGSVNHSTFARPEIFTVPHGAAAIELFRSPPADERGLAKPINRKSHLCFINHELNNNSTIKRSQA